MEEKHKIDKLFRQNFRDFEAQTPENNWGYIRNRLERAKRRRRIVAWRWASTAAAVAIAFFIGFHLKPVSPLVPEKPLLEALPQQDDIGPRQNPGADKVQVTPEKPEPAPGKAGEGQVSSASSALPLRSGKRPKSTGQPSTSVKNKEGSTTGNIQLARNTRVPAVSLPARSAAPLNRVPLPYKPSAALRFTADGPEAYAYAPALEAQQKSTLKAEHNPFFSLSLMAGPALHFKQVQFEGYNPLAEQNIENEVVNAAYTAGVELAYHPGKRWAFSTGLFYNYYRQTNAGLLLDFPRPPDGSTSSGDYLGSGFTSAAEVSVDLRFEDGNNIRIGGDPTTSSPDPRYVLIPDLEQTYAFVDIPFKAAYKITRGNFVLKAQSGFNTRWLVHSQLHLIKEDGRREFYARGEVNALSVQLIAGPGLDWRISRKFCFQLDPLLYYSLTPIDRSPELNSFWHQFVVLSGFSYRF